jgi:GNAT superfamily N-acetyltransferase
MLIRAADATELDVLSDLEMAAGVLFAGYDDMTEVAGYGRSPESLARFQAAGDAWVADDGGRAVAYIIVEPVDGCLHVEQISVHPDHMRQGIGGALLDHIAAVAAERGYPALTLTTFVEVPWNGPFYRRHGYRVLDVDEETPTLRQIRAHEAAMGLDKWPRCCMRKDV